MKLVLRVAIELEKRDGKAAEKADVVTELTTVLENSMEGEWLEGLGEDAETSYQIVSVTATEAP